MKYAFQYAYDAGVHISGYISSNIIMVEDTLAITLEEALSLYSKYKDDFLYRLKEDERPSLVIWEDVGDDEYPVYSKELLELDWRDDVKYKNGNFYKTVEVKIEIPGQTIRAATVQRGLIKTISKT